MAHKKPYVELVHFYLPPAQAVLKNASTNRLLAACIVLLCTSVCLEPSAKAIDHSLNMTYKQVFVGGGIC